jgi:hypothetical protein
MKYLLDFVLLIKRIIPPHLRKVKREAWLYSLLKPLEQAHEDFLLFRDKINEDLSYNSQTMIFEYLLNKRFNNGGTEIYITNIVNNAPPVFVGYLDEGGHSVFVGYLDEPGHNISIGYLNEYVDNEFEFIVNVPASLTFDADEMNAVIRKYKLSGKRFNIVTY